MKIRLYAPNGRQLVGGEALEILACGLLGADKLPLPANLVGFRLVVERDGVTVEETFGLAPHLHQHL